MAVNGRNGDGIAHAQVIELVEIRVHGAGRVHLIDSQDDGLSAAQQHIGNFLVRGGKARLDIREEHDDRSVVNGDLGLVTHEGQDLVIRAGLNAAGIDEGKFPAAPFGFSVNAVAGDTGGILHDGKTPPDELIEQHGLAHIGTAHDGDDGFHCIHFLVLKSYYDKYIITV